jgi:hypothetical protein
MAVAVDFLVRAVLIGTGATALMDIWAMARKRTSGVAPPDYALVGRWLGWMTRGRFRHESIAAAAPLRGERLGGWVAHSLIGVAFAAVLLALWGLEWVRHPTLGPALIVGIGSVAAPLLLMQPGMGAGIAARRTPNPRAARLRSLLTHGVFAIGLYLAGWATKLLLEP